jgi:hypothetical protein
LLIDDIDHTRGDDSAPMHPLQLPRPCQLCQITTSAIFSKGRMVGSFLQFPMKLI